MTAKPKTWPHEQEDDKRRREKGRERREKGERSRLKIKTRKTLLTVLATPGYLFMGLLKRTLEQSAMPSSQQPGCCFAPDRLLSSSLTLSFPLSYLVRTHLTPSSVNLPVQVFQAKPCQVEESLSQGWRRGAGGRDGEEGGVAVSLAGGGVEEGGDQRQGAGKGDRIQAPGDRRLGVALHCPPNINTLRFPGSDGPDNHPLSTGTIWRHGGRGVRAIFYFHKT